MFIDLEKAFDWATRPVICFALRQKSVLEYLVNEVMSLYEGCRTAVSVEGELSDYFSVKIGAHKRLTLNSLSPVIVMDILTEYVRDGSLKSC